VPTAAIAARPGDQARAVADAAVGALAFWPSDRDS
jgi:hypothetical protein